MRWAHATAAGCDFPPMKSKQRSNKSVVPQGRIWWKAMGRHPLNVMIGKVVQRLRRRWGWSLRDLACEAGLTKSYLCALEHGEHSPTLEVQLRLETAFGLVGNEIWMADLSFYQTVR
jgi:ribosome-binding protein aMBF1 (putative translation factor)